MKTIPFKTQFKAAAFAGLLFLAAGCEKEVPVKAVESTDVLPAASFTKQIAVGAQNRANASFVVEVGASDQRLLNEIDGSSFAIEFNPVADSEGEADVPHTHGDVGESLSISLAGRPHLSINVLGTYSDAPVPDFGMTFSNGFKKAVEKSNAVLTVDFGSGGGTPKVQGKTNSTFYPTMQRSTIRVRGNNAGNPEIVRFYRPGDSHLSPSFHVSYRCDKCSHSAAYIQNFRLYQGGINGFDTYTYCW